MEIGFVLFPNLTQLDLTGPLQVLHRTPGARIHLLAKTRDPVASDCGLELVPTENFQESPRLDLICVPGGPGVIDALEDEETRAFVTDQGRSARYVTSVCTGAFLLGAAGLLRGRRATTHWAYHALLSEVGAVPTRGRVVRDGDVFTGGGVTAGIDFGFVVLAELGGEDVARRVQLAMEYDPQPPFRTTPQTAPEAVRAPIDQIFAARLPTFAERLRAVVGDPQPA